MAETMRLRRFAQRNLSGTRAQQTASHGLRLSGVGVSRKCVGFIVQRSLVREHFLRTV